MRILYIANHNSGGNDDEGAITHALSELGHLVVRLDEHGWGTRQYVHGSEGADLVLFHKWCNVEALLMIQCPKAFWYFDLVRSGDPTLERRDAGRLGWMAKILPHVDLGFCTDGDWVEEYNGGCFGKVVIQDGERVAVYPEKLVWLTQGADGRVVGRGRAGQEQFDLLFTGIRRGGGRRG